MSEAVMSQFPARFNGGHTGRPTEFAHPVHVPHPSHTATRLRLTKRGRRVLIALIVLPLIIAGFFAALNGGGAGATNTAVKDASIYVTVHQGQSLWQIAESIAPTKDPRDVIVDLTNYNHIAGEVQAGQRIAIPAQYQ